VNAAIEKRNHKMIDYDSTRSKVRKMVEKPSDDTGKLPRAQAEHDEAREIYELLNDQLIAELPQLVELRIRECRPQPGVALPRCACVAVEFGDCGA
jgi:amphiphysin